MPFPLLFALADAAPAPELPAPRETTRVTLSLSATVTPESSTYGASSSNSNSSGAHAGPNAAVTFYPWTPLVDDESPRGLQPFLQRTSYVELTAGGQYLSVGYSPAAGGGRYTQEVVPASASARFFVLPQLALTGAVGADYLHDERTPVAGFPSTHDVWEPWGSVGVDLRAGDASLALQWQFVGVTESATGTTFVRPPFFLPRLSLAGRIVIDHRYDLTASVALIPDGAVGRAGVAVYPTQDLGLSVSGGVEHGQIDWNSTTDYNAAFAGPAITYWVSSRVQLALSYTPQWVSNPRTGNAHTTEWEQIVTVGITGRVP